MCLVNHTLVQFLMTTHDEPTRDRLVMTVLFIQFSKFIQNCPKTRLFAASSGELSIKVQKNKSHDSKGR